MALDIDATIAALQAMKASQPAATESPPAQSAPPAAAAPAAQPDIATLAAAIAQAMASQAKQPPPIAAAPNGNIGGSGLPTHMGLVDIFNMKPHELAAAGGPAFVRQHLERAWSVGNGHMPRPKIPGKK